MSERVPLLAVRDLGVTFKAGGGLRGGAGSIRAVDGVSFEQRPGETLGIVGESGCGKSTLARAILRLIAPTDGEVRFAGVDLGSLSRRAMRAMRRQMQIVFQDPFASLDPRLRIGATLEEPLLVHGIGSRATRRARVQELLEIVGLGAAAAARFPHEFSGGQRQRIGIARAIAVEPRLVIADEPVSALDVSIQSQILNLFLDLKDRLGLAYLFISHDLAVVRQVSDRVAVMYLGRIVEIGEADAVYRQPAHPYTQALLSAVLEPDPQARGGGIVLQGEVPNPESPPPGCPFHPRCRAAMDRCRQEPPAMREIAPGGPKHQVRCHLY